MCMGCEFIFLGVAMCELYVYPGLCLCEPVQACMYKCLCVCEHLCVCEYKYSCLWELLYRQWWPSCEVLLPCRPQAQQPLCSFAFQHLAGKAWLLVKTEGILARAWSWSLAQSPILNLPLIGLSLAEEATLDLSSLFWEIEEETWAIRSRERAWGKSI